MQIYPCLIKKKINAFNLDTTYFTVNNVEQMLCLVQVIVSLKQGPQLHLACAQEAKSGNSAI